MRIMKSSALTNWTAARRKTSFRSEKLVLPAAGCSGGGGADGSLDTLILDSIPMTRMPPTVQAPSAISADDDPWQAPTAGCRALAIAPRRAIWDLVPAPR